MLLQMSVFHLFLSFQFKKFVRYLHVQILNSRAEGKTCVNHVYSKHVEQKMLGLWAKDSIHDVFLY